MARPYTISNGWFSEVYGHPVTKRDCDEPGMGAYPYARGYPIGILEHYTAGCGSDLSGLSWDRGYVICNFSVDRTGKVYQYTPLFRGSWHAHDAGENYVGIEHSGLPGNCPLTAAERAASIKLNAAIVVAVRDLKGFQIPYDHVGGCSTTAPGYKEHCDGAVPKHCDWNPNVHTDNPVSWWGGAQAGGVVGVGWGTWFDDIRALVEQGGEDMNDEEHSALMQVLDFVKNYVRGVAGNDQAGKSDQSAAGHNAGEFIRGKLGTIDKQTRPPESTYGKGSKD